MQFMGGKARVVRRIADVMLAAKGDRSEYLEPFLGGCHVLPLMAPHFGSSLACDVVPDLVMLWQDAMGGWSPPESLPVEHYVRLRDAEPSALRAFAGFGCSFGGKWWGGYARNARGDDFAGAARRGVLRKASLLDSERVTIAMREYVQHRPGPQTLVYCDPPYAGTTPYAGAPPWRADLFWDAMRDWVKAGALVFVSEYAAPKDFTSVWSTQVKGSLAKDTNAAPVIEQLFVHESQAAFVVQTDAPAQPALATI